MTDLTYNKVTDATMSTPIECCEKVMQVAFLEPITTNFTKMPFKI
jgi:hypothetical protein